MATDGEDAERSSKVIKFDLSKRSEPSLQPKLSQLLERCRAKCSVVVVEEGNGKSSLFKPQEEQQTPAKNNDVSSTTECDVLVFVDPILAFSSSDIERLEVHLIQGGSLCFLMASSSSIKQQTSSNSINATLHEFLLKYGVQITKDCVVRLSNHKYHHPKHALIWKGCVHDAAKEWIEIQKNGGSATNSTTSRTTANINDDISKTKLSFVYPHGTTLEVTRPATTILTTGSICYPMHRPIMAAWEDDGTPTSRETRSSALVGSVDGLDRRGGDGGGRILCVGSADMLSDHWLHEEDNSMVCDMMFDFLLKRDNNGHPEKGHIATSGQRRFDPIDCHVDLIEDRKCISDIRVLSFNFRGCLDGADPLTDDISTLFTTDTDKLFRLRNDSVPEALSLYSSLKVKEEALSLIAPEFLTPMPRLTCAVHLPRFPELPPPALELFDLADQFLPPDVRLAHLTHKCMQLMNKKQQDDGSSSSATINISGEELLAHYVKEAGRTVLGNNTSNRLQRTESKIGKDGLGDRTRASPQDPKQVSGELFDQLLHFRLRDTSLSMNGF
jgi:intraflagellar transport protein 52